jgi:clathrin heavy chain
MQTVDRYGVVFVITKFGYLYIYEIANAVLLFRQRITDSLIFVATKNPNTDGMICINKAG